MKANASCGGGGFRGVCISYPHQAPMIPDPPTLPLPNPVKHLGTPCALVKLTELDISIGKCFQRN